uniref:Transmembrane protein n=1 Tax=Globisporangium ultimum (strain ATCC 200006 / CBS 805.95 / DAOM BR144) TaxID=431595 RepID=K3X4Q9_GLOUD
MRSLLPGFAELKSFCELHDHDASFAYDASSSTTCKLNADYTVSIEDVNALVAAFSDDTPWVWNASNATASSTPPNSTRVALLLDAFLAQPFTTMRDCSFVVKNIALAFDLAEDRTSESCVQDANSGGIYLDLPMLTSAGFTSKPRAFLTDIQAYLRYAGTKFGYEPSVLGRKPVALSSDGPVPSTASLKYPIGGYIAVTTISDTIFASKANPYGGFWRNDSLARNDEGADSVMLSPSMVVPQQFTMQVPLEHDLKLFKKRNNVVGEILAIDNATEVLVWGMRVVLSGVRVTDGSQFTTLVLATKYTNGGDKFPPQKFLFYWEYARRLVQFEYERNVTRFGASLMRYTVTNWLEPTSLPTGLDESQTALLNMSLLLDDLQFAVGAASPLLTEAANATVDVDPLTGSVCHSRMVWQLSARVQRDAARDVWHNAILDCWLPVVWVQEQASVSARKGLTFASAARGGPFAKEKVAKWEVIGGCVYIVVGAALLFFYARRARMLKRLLQAQNVLPEQTVCLLDDETLPTSVGSPTQASRQVGGNDAEVTAVRQPLTTVAQSDSSNHRDQLTHLHSSGSRSGRSGRRKTQHIQTIIEQTDGISDDAESNGGANVSVRT